MSAARLQVPLSLLGLSGSKSHAAAEIEATVCRCEQMGPEIVYVSGRKRASGEMNGKSANLNNCLSYIYPAGTTIPANELVCIFDADQVCLLALKASQTCRQAGRGQ